MITTVLRPLLKNPLFSYSSEDLVGMVGSTMLRAKEKVRRSSIVCRSKERENGRLIYRERTILGEAEYHNRSPKPNTSTGARPVPWYGAGAAHGGYKPPA